jgi:Tol biopolymer transport system component
MTTPMRRERDLSPILTDLAMAPYPDYVDDVLGRTGRMRQRPAWTFPGRWLPMDLTTHARPMTRLPWRQLGALALIALLLAVALAVYVGSQRRLPAPFGPARNGLIPYVSQGDIYVGDPVTGQTRLVVGGPEADWGPGYSADGTMLGFVRDVPATNGTTLADIYVVRPGGSDLRRITSNPIDGLVWAQWTPDGRMAVIHGVDGTGCPTTICLTNRLDVIDAVANGAVSTIATASGMDYVQFRPPDGHELLYRARVDGKWGLFAMGPDGKNARTIIQPTVPASVDLSFSGATYSSDGSRIFFEHGDEDSCCRLWVVNADGTDPHEFLPRGAAWDGEAVPSPDGKFVAYWHNGNELSAHGISVVRADGTGTVIDTGPSLPGTAHWLWAPDSSKILMFPKDGSSDSAYLLDPNGGPWTTVPWHSDADIDWQRLAP